MADTFDDANPFAAPPPVPAKRTSPQPAANPFSPTVAVDNDFSPRSSTPKTTSSASSATSAPPAKPKPKTVDNPFSAGALAAGASTIASANDSAEVLELRRQLEVSSKKLNQNLKKIEELEDKLYPLIPNWPKCYPIVFHDIAYDMKTPATASICKHMYALWWWSCVCYFWNMVCMGAALGIGLDEVTWYFILSVAYFFVLPIVAFFTWYGKLYHAMKKDKSGGFFMHFVFFFIHIGIVIMMVVGFKETASAGLLLVIKVFDMKENSVGYMMIASFGCWFINLIDSIYLVYRVNKFYRQSGEAKIIAKAKAEEASKANKDVEAAV